MKRIFLPLYVLTFVLILAGLWIVQAGENDVPRTIEYIFVGIIIVFMMLGIFFGISRIRRSKQGFPEEDELSQMISLKSAAVSYYLSLVVWLILIYIQAKVEIDTKWILALGIIGMSITFIITWTIIRFKGPGHEKQD